LKKVATLRLVTAVLGLPQVKGADGRLRNVQQGDLVARGLARASVRAKDYTVKVDQANGQLAQARANLVTTARQAEEAEVGAEKARLDFERARDLFDTQSLTRPEYDAAKSQYDLNKVKTETARDPLAVVQAQIAAAEAAQSAAAISRDDTHPRAPIDGLLLERAVEVGELISPGKPEFVLADTSFVRAQFGVPNLEVQKLRGQPVIVFAAVPYGVVGSLAVLWLMGSPFGFMAFLGIVSLVGVIVSHIIVLFDFIEEAHEQGKPLEEALLDAGIVRLRPVLITVAATVIALVPLAAHGGPLWEPMCYAQIGGLTAATFVTLLVVPVLYVIFVRDLKIVKWETP
jgi:hypothetical protein